MTRARFSRAANMAVEFLIRHEVRALPVNPFELARLEGISVYTYSELSGKCGVAVSDICEMYGSADAFSLRRCGGYAIVYNDTSGVPARIRWSVCHEIGHCVLGHFEDSSAGALAALDMEADAFAANVMAPVCAFDMLEKPLREDYRRVFGLSRLGWEVRRRTACQDRRRVSPCAARVLARRLSRFFKCGEANDIDVESRVILGLKPEQRPLAYMYLENPMVVNSYWASGR